MGRECWTYVQQEFGLDVCHQNGTKDNWNQETLLFITIDYSLALVHNGQFDYGVIKCLIYSYK